MFTKKKLIHIHKVGVLAGLICLVTIPSLAVDVKKCPEKVYATYVKLEPFVDFELDEAILKSRLEGFTPDIRNERNVFTNMEYYDYSEVIYKIKSRSRGTCSYSVEYEDASPAEETRIFSQRGKDYIRVALKSGENVFWTQHRVVQLTKENFGIEKEKTEVLGFFQNGTPKVQLGWAYGTVGVY